MPATPIFPSFCLSTCRSVTRMRAPEQPIGWPRPTAPPLTFTLDASRPRSLLLARDTTEKASLISQKSTSVTDTPARSRAIGMALEGAVVNLRGSCAASAKPLMVASGVNPFFSANAREATISAAAPSFKEDALAAVTVPSFLNAGRREGTLSALSLWYSSSSLIILGSPLLWGMATSTISSANKPFSLEFCTRRYDSRQKLSWSSLVKPISSAIDSAHIPMW
mmetsp:Transcript_15030/g.28600  ORF Transcript_15030/g.28600 Transcript_15030/m.28600 type:complete len:223 (+) Transcript_15030:372-1040(+)